MSPGPTRRQVLEALLGSSVAGASTAAGTGRRAAPATVSEEGLDRTGQAALDGWPAFGHDAANTGHAPGESAAIDRPGREWRFSAGGPVASSPAVVDGTVYVAGSDGTAYALDAATGKQQWASGANVAVGDSPAVVDGTVYFGGADSTVYALDVGSGVVEWTFDTRGVVRSSPTVADGTVYVGSDSRRLHAVDADSGSQQWRFAAGFPVRSTPAYDGERVYVGSDSGNVHAIDDVSGELAWNSWTSGPVRSPPAVARDVDIVAVGSEDGSLYRFDQATGDELFRFDTGAPVSASPAFVGDMVYVGNHDGRVFAIRANADSPAWTATVEGAVRSSPAVVDGLVVVGSDDGGVYGFDTGSGEQVWRFETGGAVRSSPAVVDDTVVVGSDDGGVYAVTNQPQTTTPPPTSPPPTTPPPTTPPPTTPSTPATNDEAGQDVDLPVDPLVVGAGGAALLGGGALVWGVLARRGDGDEDDGADDADDEGGDGRGATPATDDDGENGTDEPGDDDRESPTTADEGGSTPDATPEPGSATDASAVVDEAETLVADCHPEGPAAAALSDARTHLEAGNEDLARERATQAKELAQRELERIETVRAGEGAPTIEDLRERATVYGLDDELAAVETLVETVAEGREAIDAAETLVEDCHPEGPAAAALADARTHYRQGNYERARERATQAREIAEMELDRLETARQSGEGVDEELLSELREEATEFELAYVDDADIEGDSSGESVDPLAGNRPPETVPSAPDLSLSYDAIARGERLGSGGTADVYRARVTTPDGEELTIALKEPRFEDGDGSAVLAEFEREAETWDNLDDHDNVVGVVDFGSDPHPWIAMEYMDCGTLSAVAGEAGLRQAVWTALGTVQGVYHAHEYGVAHLDLKPGNVLLRSAGEDTWPVPKIADWGLARLLLEYTGSVRGYTPLYAAPEQVDRDRFGTPGKRTDIYQLGAVCYALFTGRPPHTGEASKVVYDVLESPVTPPTELAPSLPKRVDEILLKALEKEKSDRYETIVYLRDDLRELYDEL